MKIRTARKILKIWDCQTDKRFYESDDIKDGKKFRHFANLYRKANIRWNKANDPQANVSIFKAIIRNAKSCEHCAHYEAFQAYGEMVGRCNSSWRPCRSVGRGLWQDESLQVSSRVWQVHIHGKRICLDQRFVPWHHRHWKAHPIRLGVRHQMGEVHQRWFGLAHWRKDEV